MVQRLIWSKKLSPKEKLKLKFHTDQFPLNKLGIRVCDICIEIDDSKKELENQNNVYPELLN